MSLVIPDPFLGNNVIIESCGFGVNAVSIGNSHFTMKRFLRIVYYILTHTELKDSDPRIEFLENIKKAKIVDGWSKKIDPKRNSKRIELPAEIS